jgi:hypothetical protein
MKKELSKKELKSFLYAKQAGKCALCSSPLPKNLSKTHIHRILPKAKGGKYTEENSVVYCPLCHFSNHDILVERNEALDELKSIIDDRNQVMKLRNKINNQILAYKSNVDSMNSDTLEFLTEHSKPVNKRLSEIDANLKNAVEILRKCDPLVDSALNVRGVGHVVVAYCTVYIKLEEARHASSLWKYVGLHTSKKERFTKGKSSGGNRTLRTALWTFADSQMKSRNETITSTGKKNPPSAYGYLYDQYKTRYENSDKITPCLISKTEGWKDLPWSDPKQKNHRHHAALRKIMKRFLGDYWLVGRTLKGLPTDLPYAEAILGKNHKSLRPEHHGWVYEKPEINPISVEDMEAVSKATPEKKPMDLKRSSTKKPTTTEPMKSIVSK